MGNWTNQPQVIYVQQPKRKNGCLGCLGVFFACLLIIPIFHAVMSVVTSGDSAQKSAPAKTSTESEDFWGKAAKDMEKESHRCKTQAELEERWKQFHAMEVHSACYSFLNEPRFNSKGCLELQDPDQIEDEARSHQRDVEQNNRNCPAPIESQPLPTQNQDTVPPDAVSAPEAVVDSDPIATLQVVPKYTQEARDARFSGTVILSALIDENGVPTDIQVIQSQPYGLEDEAIKALKEWRFKPAVKNGQNVVVRTNIDFPFTMLQ